MLMDSVENEYSAASSIAASNLKSFLLNDLSAVNRNFMSSTVFRAISLQTPTPSQHILYACFR